MWAIIIARQVWLGLRAQSRKIGWTVFEEILAKTGRWWQRRFDFVSKKSIVRNVSSETVLPSLIVILCCSIVSGGSYSYLRPVVASKQSECQKNLCDNFIKLNLIQRYRCSGSQWNGVRKISLLNSLPGKRVRWMWHMHAAVSEKRCIWRTVFFVRNLCFEKSESFEFD
jgi:hypothetical protein